MTEFNILGNMSTADFLKNYWEKKPLLIKNAVPNANDFLSFEKLIELSKDEDIESRMVIEPDKENGWQLIYGPLSNSDYKQKQNKKWTAIVHGLNHYILDFFKLKEAVDFIPGWSFDDVMVSHSAPDSSVGPHIDSYNVFIVQAHGKKKWSLQSNPNPDIIEDLDIKILKEFNPDTEWILDPGDIIYIPPHVAHHGVSQDFGLSYSIGFNSLNYIDMLLSYTSQFVGHVKPDIHTIPNAIGLEKDEITSDIMDEVQKSLAEFAFRNDDAFKEWFGKYSTEPKKAAEENDPLDYAEFNELLREMQLFRDEFLRFNFYKCNEVYKVFINAKDYTLNSYKEVQTLRQYLTAFPMNPIDLTNHSESINKVLFDIYLAGDIFFTE